MITLDDARNALDRLVHEDLGTAERLLAGQVLLDYIDHVGAENMSLELAHRHESGESARHFADASQKENELRTLRGVVGRCKSELAELTNAAMRACALLEGQPMTAGVCEAVTAVRIAMKGQQARHYASVLSDSVRKFAALAIMHRMLRKLRVSEDVYRAADEWAKKQLKLREMSRDGIGLNELLRPITGCH